MPTPSWTEEESDLLVNTEEEMVLATLRELLAKVNSPIVRICLSEAHDDIAHLMGCEPVASTDLDHEDAA